MRDRIERYWHELCAVADAMPYAALGRVADTLLECNQRGNTVFVLGNGGSASTASHFACDLAKGTRTPGRPAFRVIPLTDNVPMITAWGNDTSFDRVFAEQLSALVRPHDVVLVISASGNSPNVVAAIDVARDAGAITIALTGESGGHAAPMADIAVRVPLIPIEQVEDAHSMITHSLCVAIRERMRSEAVDVLVAPVFASGTATATAASMVDGE